MIYAIPRRRLLAAAAATLVAVTACTDAETPTSVAAGPAKSMQANNQAGIIHEPIFPAFNVELSATGSMQPGRPIDVHVRVRANLPVADAELVVTTPDLWRKAVPTFDSRFSRAPQGGVKPRASRRAGWQKGQAMNETVRLTIPAPGYYRVTASVFARSELPGSVDGAEVVGDIHREIWLRVDKRGGRYTASFDTLAFPAEAERRAGPLHCTVDLDEERRGKKRDPACDGALVTLYDPEENPDGPVAMAIGDEICIMSVATGCEGGGGCDVGMDHCLPDPCLVDPYSCSPTPYVPPAPVDPCYAGTHLCIEFFYRDTRFTPAREVPAPEGTLVEGSYQDRDCFITCWWEEERSTFVRANSLGRVMLQCPSSSTEKRLRTAYEFLDDFTAVSRSEWYGPMVRGTCPRGWQRVEMVANQEAFVFGNMRKSAQHAVLAFGRSSPRVRVDFDGGTLTEWGLQGTSWYDAPRNTISINQDAIWRPGTHAHEYGHSFHNMALGGIGHIYISGWPEHDFEGEWNGAKALLEGFAEFFETLVLPGTSSIHKGVRWPEHWENPLPTGPDSEARVAAYLWDVIDYADEGSSYESLWGTVPGVHAPETFDLVQIAPRTLGEVIDTCGSPSWGLLDSRPESIEGIHRCLVARTGQGTNLERLFWRIYGIY
jgi:hypothetical protein